MGGWVWVWVRGAGSGCRVMGLAEVLDAMTG